MDTTGLDALEQLWETLRARGVRVILCGLNEQPLSLMQRAGFAQRVGQAHVQPDLAQALALARMSA